MTKLSDTTLIILGNAAERDDRLAELPAKLPAGARATVARSLMKQRLLEEVPSGLASQPSWREDDDGQRLALRITDAGFRALNLEPPVSRENAATDAHTAPQESSIEEGEQVAALASDAPVRASVAPTAAPMPRPTIRQAAATVLEEWDDRDNHQSGLPEAIERLRAALATKPGRPARQPGAPRKPREGTKQQAVLALLGRAEGTTIAQVIESTAWAPHTVRGFLAGLKKKGHNVEVLDRVRMVGPNKDGAKGSYSIYRVTAPAAG